ncbi:MAG: prenyltransferase/squalene oxidase repeat-containing protein, partial [Planctomycetota bacterium]
IGALAMAEAFAMTGSPLFKQSAQRGIDFVHKCQNPYLAWRYGVRPGENDTSVTGWMVMALKSAKVAGLKVDQSAFDGAKAWLDKGTEPEYGRAGYTKRGDGPARKEDMLARFPPEKSESLTAVGILSRIFVGEDPARSEIIQKGVDLCMKALPVWDRESGSIDMYYWYYGTLAMFQVGGDPWRQWNDAIKDAIVDTQRKDGDEKGSWDPVGVWGREGGRVYSTALNTMCMEVYYRYGRVFGTR